MKDIINSSKAHLYDRTKSPFLGAFSFYWIICNYKFLMIIFDSDLNINQKFEFIKSIYPQNKVTLWDGVDIYYYILIGNGLLIPLLITLAYILLLPFISNKIHKFWLKHQDNLKEISNKQLHTDKEFGELREDFMELQLKFNETFKSMNEEISKKNTLISKKDETIANLEKTISEYKNREQLTIDEYRGILSTEVEEKYENEKSQKNHYISLLEPDNSVLKTLNVDEKIILYTIHKHKDKKIWNVLTASTFTKNEAGESLLEKGLIEKAEHEHYQLSEEGKKIFE